MVLLARLLRRWLGRPTPGSERRERAAEEAEAGEPPEVSPDDLTAIRGIGIATQHRLYGAGIKSYGQLGRAAPPPSTPRSIIISIRTVTSITATSSDRTVPPPWPSGVSWRLDGTDASHLRD